MPKRELKEEEREKRRQAFQTENAPESSTPPSEDSPEQMVTLEAEGDALETEGESTEILQPPKTKPKRRKFRGRSKREK